jgi:hypothetical protein
MLIRPLVFMGTVGLGLAMLVGGQGDTDFLRLIDESFAFFNPNAVVPNRTTLYQPEWDTLPPENGGGL